MANITNVQIFALDESIYRSGYPMLKEAPTEAEFQAAVAEIKAAREAGEMQNPHIRRAIKLANAKGGGHEQFLSGITVTFDMTLSNKAWVEAERYRFLTFISSKTSSPVLISNTALDVFGAHWNKPLTPNIDTTTPFMIFFLFI